MEYKQEEQILGKDDDFSLGQVACEVPDMCIISRGVLAEPLRVTWNTQGGRAEWEQDRDSTSCVTKMGGRGSKGAKEKLLQTKGGEPGENDIAAIEGKFSNAIEKTSKIPLSLMIKRQF